ncbi:MAG: hypothetical protein GXY32_09710 [Ruminococcaceae bacterium]|nr:hypothetical protein [Oscillospiraceae bacterium]
MKKKRPVLRTVVALVIFLAIEALLYLVHPLVPVLVLGSVLIQAPIIWGIFRRNFNMGYRQRAAQRRERYKESGDAEAWLAGEQRETRMPGYKYWSRGGKALVALNCADALLAMGRRDAAGAQLAEVDRPRLEPDDQQRFDEMILNIRGAARFDTPLPDDRFGDEPGKS